MELYNNSQADIGFLLLPGLAPDNQPVLGMEKFLRKQGYAAYAVNFWGRDEVSDFSKLSLQATLSGVADAIRELKQKHKTVIGIGVCLGGALLLEHAKTHTDLDAIVSIGTPFKLKKQRLIELTLTLYPLLWLLWFLPAKIKAFRMFPIPAGEMSVRFCQNQFLEGLEKITTSALFLHSSLDYLSDYRVVEEFASKLSSRHKQVMVLHDTDHVMDYSGDIVLQHLTGFMKAV